MNQEDILNCIEHCSTFLNCVQEQSQQNLGN